MRAPLSAIRSGRRAAVAKMIDECRVTRKAGVADEITGVTPTTVVYEGRALSQTYEAWEQTPEAGGHSYTVQRYSVHFPWDGFVPQVDDVVEWTDCPLSPERVGTRERITSPFDKTFHTALRVPTDRLAEG